MIKSRELSEPNSCLSKARDDEMTFILLERDPAAPAAIRAWIEERIRLGLNERGDAKLEEAAACSGYMEHKLLETMNEARHPSRSTPTGCPRISSA